MGRIVFAICCWSLAICLAASKYALAVAIPLGALLAGFGLKLLAHGVSVHTFLIGVAVVWTLGVVETLVEGVWLFNRDCVEQAVNRWTWSVSMIGLALTFTVALQHSSASWAALNGQPAVDVPQWPAEKRL